MTSEEEARIRKEEREWCAKLIEGISGCYDGVSVVPEKIADSEWAEVEYNVNRKAPPNQRVPLWLIKVAVEYARFVTFERGRKILASALRSGTDTDYVCVRREDLRELLLYMAHVKGQGSDTYTRLRSLLKEKGGENG